MKSRRRQPGTELSILDCIDSPQIWGGWFKRPETWAPWRNFLACLFGLPANDAELIRQCTGRSDLPDPKANFTEAWLVCGRRAGKSFTLALIASYLAVFRDWSPYLIPGEPPVIKIVAVDKKQARAIFKYTRALLTRVPAFQDLVVRDAGDEIELSNGITIEIQTASFRTTRSSTLIACLLDEVAYLRTDEFSANPDAEILAAVRPAFATMPGAMLLAASSPYAKRGSLYEAFRDYHGRDGAPVLVWHAPTRTMNPTVRQSFVDRELERDPARAAAEYLAEFRSDIDTFLDRELVEQAIDRGVTARPPRSGIRYAMFADQSGGRNDSFTAAVGHRERDVMVIDATLERRAPFTASTVFEEVSALAKSYRVSTIYGDTYGAELTVDAFRRHGIAFKNLRPHGEGTPKLNRSEIYLNSVVLFTSGRARLLDSQRLMHQLTQLQRKTGRGNGKDIVDHPRDGADDLANSVCGCLVALATKNPANPLALKPDQLRRQLATLRPRNRFAGVEAEYYGRPMRNRFARSR